MTDVIVMLTPAETAKRLGVSRHAVYDMCAVEDRDGNPRQPELGHNRIGSRIVIPAPEVDALLARTFVPAKSEVTSLDEHRHRSRQAA
ncbi:helix-turn-helix domain-containing protein [Glycomyces sp. NPDC021274]|uniref:helix-turn-helix domain-containing protein n=1 Tax=Glycomyces sp. NPDC021274 TaxID=3155120 RepID=UPI0033CEA606